MVLCLDPANRFDHIPLRSDPVDEFGQNRRVCKRLRVKQVDASGMQVGFQCVERILIRPLVVDIVIIIGVGPHDGPVSELRFQPQQPFVDRAGRRTEEHHIRRVGKLSLEIKKGEYVAFTGHSGCGKSTVLKLLMSMYPLDSGERYITCSQGRESLDPSWRRLFAYVPQGNVLMSGSIKDIVTFGDVSHADDEERIKRALFIACADGFVDDISTVLGERGTGLSEGQMQRLAIARAVFSDRPILLLDEATSALDEATEKQVLENLRALTDKTVIIVTHRRAALSVCDREIDLSNERQM